ncbi:carboxypeptidase-like regulatory domain-containing protein [Sphingobacterium sp. 2149]|nr:carboxypeptidase-like regulatory domain-containing protein [Sphingobacterium sp. 2149]MDR6735344.1 hypothetical protein [Sphingobacterium sp. 2149]
MLKHYYNRYSKKGILLNSLFLIAMSSYGQSANVKGVIKDTSGKGIAGVTIRVKGGAETVQTNGQGNFSIQASPGSTLIITSVGFKEKQITIGQQANLDVALVPAENVLEELVVVGYGSQKRSDITGSVASVPKDRLSKIPVNNVMQAIQGAVSNVTVSQASSIPGDAPSV